MINYCAEATIYVNLNLAGNGSGYCYVGIPVLNEEWDSVSHTTYYYYGEERISESMAYTDYEIISVSGTATKN